MNKIASSFNDLLTEVAKEIENTIKERTNSNLILDILDAYNTYQEDERDGVDYIFDITKKNDLMVCIDGGLTASEIAEMSNAQKVWFMFGQNHEKPETLTWDEVLSILQGHAWDVAKNVLAYCARGDESYRKIYETFVVEKLGSLL